MELDLDYDLDVVWNIWFKSWNWGLKNVQNWAHTRNAAYTKSKKTNWNWNYMFHQIPIVNEKKPSMLLFILHDDQIAKQMKMTNSLKFCHFG
jgi:hypothetical protein